MATKVFSGEQIKKAREQLGWSRTDLMLKLFEAGLRVHEATISNWEQDHHMPGADDLGMLAQVLKKTMDFFYLPGD